MMVNLRLECINNNLRRAIKIARKNKKISVDEVAKFIHVSTELYMRLERVPISMPFAILRKLDPLLGLDLEAILALLSSGGSESDLKRIWPEYFDFPYEEDEIIPPLL